MMTRHQLQKQGSSSVCLLCRHRFALAQGLRSRPLQYTTTSLRTSPLSTAPLKPRANSTPLWKSARQVLGDRTGVRRAHSNSGPSSQDGVPNSQTTKPQTSSKQSWSIPTKSSWGGGWGAAAQGPSSGVNPGSKTDGDGGSNLLPHEKLARDRARLKASTTQPTAAVGQSLNRSQASTEQSSNFDRTHIGTTRAADKNGWTRRRDSPAPAFPSKSSYGLGHFLPKNTVPARTSRVRKIGQPSHPGSTSQDPQEPPNVHRSLRTPLNAAERGAGRDRSHDRRENWGNDGSGGLPPSRNNDGSHQFTKSDGHERRLPSQPLMRSTADSSRASTSVSQEWGQLNRRNSGSPTESSFGRYRGNAEGRRRPDPPSRRILGDNALKKAGTEQADDDAYMNQFQSRLVGAEPGRTTRTASSIDKNESWVDRTKSVTQIEQDGQSSKARTFLAATSTPNIEARGRGRERPEKPKKKARPQRRNSHGQDEEDEDEGWLRAEERRRRREEKQAEKERELAEAGPTPILLPEFISVSNLAGALGVKSELFIEQLGELGFENISYDSIMTGETAALVAGEYGFDPTVNTGDDVDLKPRPPPSDLSSLPPRPPIVTIMGHVDHGKTTMLDWLRKSSVAAQEHGGITQHIGAFSVRLSTGKQITFLDTPGHAAFLTMRQRGANVTDIVILVVAADDSVKPQTLEALKHARAAKVPIIVAINKIDKDEARVDHVKADLARHGIEIEDFGGDVQVVCVSGKTGEGMNDLEENILTLSEILDVRAETDGMAEGWILEASIKPIGKVATVLVKRGTLRIGDYIVAGTTWAKVRVIRNEAGVDIEEAAPGTAVEILGWRGDPIAGDEVIQAPDESKAKIATHYREEIRDRESAVATKAAQEQQEREKAEKENTEDTPEPEESGTKIVNFIVKGDVVGSVEAVCAAIMEIGSNEVRPRVLRSSAGQVTESDVDHAATSKGMIISFNNPIAGFIKQRAKDVGVKILDYNVIYHLTDEVKDRLSDLLPPLISTRVVGEAEVLQVFPINLKGRVFKNIAGCRVRNGQISRTAKYRVLRSGESVFQGSLDSLKHGKKDVDEMKKGSECGISFEGWDDIRQGDQIQAYEETQEKRHL